jgi:peptide/nickel transport system ATP-binding protein
MIGIDRLAVELDAEAGTVRAIDGLALTLARGETFALVGESGCGKSMTALALMRLLPDNGIVTAGSVRLWQPGAGVGLVGEGGEAAEAGQGSALGAVELLDLPEAAMRRVRGARIGMIFQEPATSLNPVMRVGEQIVEAIETHTPLRGAEARAKALAWLERVGIPEPARRIDDYPFRMSGGQKQRVMIAIALAAEPDFLVADEPTTALDVTIQSQVLELLRDLQRERRMGLMLITHDLAVVAGMAHRVALMYAGQIVEVAPAAQFFAAPRHPYAQALLRALPGRGPRGQPLQAIGGTVPKLTQAFGACRFAPRCALAHEACLTAPPELRSAGPDHEVRCVLVGAGPRASPQPGPLPRPQAQPAAPRAGEGAEAPSAPVLPGTTTASHPLPHPQAEPAAPRAGEGRGEGASRSPTPLLQVQNLTVRFSIRGGPLQRVRAHFDAVREVSFHIGRGETLALVGESGCGKTTTGKAIVQLLRGVAEIQGNALLDGSDLFALQGEALKAARRRVQIVFQDPYASLNPRMRIAELLEEGIVALRPEMPPAERRSRIAELIERVGLRVDALERYPHEFSGGQRQRLAIARALAVQPELIVCDEPTSALDVSVQAQILNLLGELQRSLRVSYLFITHNIAVVEFLADRVAVMQAGRIVEQGDAPAVLSRPTHPYTAQLLAAVPRLPAPV